MLQSLLRIRIYLQVHEKCCKTFQSSTEMINRFKSNFMYGMGTEISNCMNPDNEENDENLHEMIDVIGFINNRGLV